MGTPIYKISATAAAYAIPKAGSDSKIAAGYIPDLSATYAAASHTHNASAITAGTLDNARVNWAAPSAIGSGTPAAITGTTGTFSGNFAVDTNVLLVDTSNNRIGINNSTPTATLTIGSENGATDDVISASANAARFSVRSTGNGTNAGFRLFAKSSGSVSRGGGAYFSSGATASASYFGITGDDTNFHLTVLSTGLVGIGAGFISPSTRLHVLESTANTATPVNVLAIGANSSGTAAAGFGAGVAFTLESSTTNDRASGYIRSLWNAATDAAAIADMVLVSAYNAAGTVTEREGLRIRGGASATAIGFYGATPVAKPALGAWAGLTTDQKLDALRDALSNLGLASYS